MPPSDSPGLAQMVNHENGKTTVIFVEEAEPQNAVKIRRIPHACRKIEVYFSFSFSFFFNFKYKNRINQICI